jgi:hypothetical protein
MIKQNTKRFIMIEFSFRSIDLFCLPLFILYGLSAILYAQDQPKENKIKEIIQSPSKALRLQSDWQNRANAWFKGQNETEKRQEMRVLSKSIEYGCFDCHVKGFKGYLSNLEIARQMMAISYENDVLCDDCHVGKLGLNEMGQKAKWMWDWSIELQKECKDCHESKQKFKVLREDAKQYEKEWEKRSLKLPTILK